MKSRLNIIIRFGLSCLVAAVTLSGCARQPAPEQPGSGGLELIILHANDTHSHIAGIDKYGNASFDEKKSRGGFGRIATAVRTEKQLHDNVIALDAGDQFQGTLFYSVNKWPMIADFDRFMPWDAMTLGNHEFDEGCLELTRFLDKLGFPVLAANLRAEKGCPLSKSDIPAHKIMTVRGVKVGIIGLANDEVVELSAACPHTKFRSARETLAEEVRQLEAMGVHCIIALTHLGLPADKELARSVDGIDVIVGGHTHSYLGPGSQEGPYPTVVQSPSGKPVLVVTAKYAAQYLGKLEVTFDGNGVPVSWKGEAQELANDIVPDREISLLTEKYLKTLDAFRKEKVSEQNCRFPDGMDACRENDCLSGMVTVDAMLDFARKFDASAAVCNGGAMRAALPVGTVTKGDLLSIYPFGNTFMVREFTGEQLLDALEHGVSQEGGKGPRILQAAGMSYAVDGSLPAGKRISRVMISDGKGSMQPLSLKKTYRIALTDYLIGGGDGYAVFKEGKYVSSPQVLIMEIVEGYLKKNSPLKMPEGKRINRIH